MIGNKSAKQVGFALSSFLLGVWAFLKVNSISGPSFEPIIAACSNPDYKGNIDAFVSETGYHAYEPVVGLKLFEMLVCLITQFLFELRQTYPAGFLTWGGVVTVALPAGAFMTIEAGRKGARGVIRYSVLIGLLCQLFGISVIFPLLWIPGYVLGRGNGPISNYRIALSVFLSLPGVVLTAAVFAVETNSYTWVVCAGILGGPLLPMGSLLLWNDAPPSFNKEEVKSNILSVKNVYKSMALIGTLFWCCSMYIVYDAYASSSGGFGTTVKLLWSDVWINANASVAFMTIDTLVLYAGLLLGVAFQSLEKAMKAIILTPLLGPAAASIVLAELEEIRHVDDEDETKKEA